VRDIRRDIRRDMTVRGVSGIDGIAALRRKKTYCRMRR